jgi:hypothetical protein
MVMVPALARAGDEPWAVGVTEQQKEAAQKLLTEGNNLFVEKKYPEALEKYNLAIKSWDHPAIRFNIVRCLIQLDKPVEASDNLVIALKYGQAPLEQALYDEALNYQKLLAQQIGELDVHCEQAGVKVTLDGQALLTCPGKEHRRVAPGQHQLVGTKDGYLTSHTEVVVLGAKTADSKIQLVELGKAAKVVHRWPTWLPWTVFGGGLALAGVGGLVQYLASSDMNQYDRDISTACGGTGCAPTVPIPGDTMGGMMPNPNIHTDLKDRAQLENKLAIGVMTVGFGAAIAGGVMLYMNRGRTVYEEAQKPAPAITIAPTANGGGMLTFAGSF